MITKHSLNDLKRRIDIVTIVEKTVSLQQSGLGCFSGRSPFIKNAKVRSLVVSKTYQIFQCLETGKEGDVFEWLEETEGIRFWQAAHDLADENGLTLQYSRKPYFAKPKHRKPTQRHEKTKQASRR